MQNSKFILSYLPDPCFENVLIAINFKIIIQFNSLSFMCPVDSYKSNYRHSTVIIAIIIIIFYIYY
jgi:hypothetical protein